MLTGSNIWKQAHEAGMATLCQQEDRYRRDKEDMSRTGSERSAPGAACRRSRPRRGSVRPRGCAGPAPHSRAGSRACAQCRASIFNPFSQPRVSRSYRARQLSAWHQGVPVIQSEQARDRRSMQGIEANSGVCTTTAATWSMRLGDEERT